MKKGNLFGEKNLLIPNITDEAGAEKFESLDYYKQRVLTIAKNTDFMIMPSNTEKYNIELEKIFKDLGVEFINSENIFYVENEGNISNSILKDKNIFKKLQNKDYSNIFAFINSKNIDKISEITGIKTSRTNENSEKINDKSFAQEELRKLGVLVPEGKVVNSQKEAEDFFSLLKEKGYEKVTIKLKRAFSGMGVFTAENLLDFQKIIEKHKEELEKDGLLIDGWIKGKFISSPNIQFDIGKTEKEDIFIGASDQILEDGKIHLGNISDRSIVTNNLRLQQDLKKINNWIRSQKAYGVVGIDFAIFEDENTGKQNAYFMEINGRVNGSTHGNVLAERIYGENYHDTWAVANNVKIPNGWTFNDFILKLESDGIYFNPDKKTGVLITNISTIEKFNKVMVAIFGNKNTIMETLKILNSYYK